MPEASAGIRGIIQPIPPEEPRQISGPKTRVLRTAQKEVHKVRLATAKLKTKTGTALISGITKSHIAAIIGVIEKNGTNRSKEGEAPR